MGKRVGVVLALGFLTAAFACGSDGDPVEGGECTGVATRCEGLVLTRCESGQWKTYDCATHCASSGLEALGCSDPELNGTFTCTCGTTYPDSGVAGMAGLGGAGGTAGTGATAGASGTAGSGGAEPYVPCNGVPTDCAGVGPDEDAQYYGCCLGDLVYWCDDQSGTWELSWHDCSEEQQTCKYAADFDSMYCAVGSAGGSGGAAGAAGSSGAAGAGGGGQEVLCNGTPANCADVGPDETAQFYGCCDGDTVHWCQDEGGVWTLLSEDCGSQGMTCHYVASWESMYCEGAGGSAGSSGGGGAAGASDAGTD